MKKALLLILTLCLSQLMMAVEKNVDIKVGDKNRSFKLYVPSSAKDNCPLVVSLHGASGSSNDKSPFGTDVADQAGCIVVYPQGLQIYFPVFGGSVNGWDATGEKNADAEFLLAVIDEVAKSYKIDRKRIYCCGFSNGGMMTYAMSCACSDVFADLNDIACCEVCAVALLRLFVGAHEREDALELLRPVVRPAPQVLEKLSAPGRF